MATPTILIEQVGRPPGASGSSRDDLLVGNLCTLTDPANGAGTYVWTMLTRPTLSAAVLSGANTDTATFTPDVEGTYLFSVTFDGTLSGTIDVIGQFLSSQGGAGVKDAYGTRAPAAGETVQFGLEGWHPAREESIHAADRLRSALDAVQGSVFYADASGNVQPLAPSTSGYVLATQGGGSPPAWVLADSVGGNTLNASYNEGGGGVGRAIVADNGAVTVTGAADANNVLELTTVATATGAALTVTHGGAGDYAMTVDAGLSWFNGGVIAGDPGFENGGITIGGVTYESSLKVSDIGGTNAAQMIMHRHSSTLGPVLIGARAQGDVSGHTVVNDNDVLLDVFAVGWDGADYAIGGRMFFAVDGTPGIGDMPTEWVLQLSPDASEIPGQVLRVDNASRVHAVSYVAGEGTAVTPTYSFTAATNKGMYSSGGQLRFSVGSLDALRLTGAAAILGSGYSLTHLDDVDTTLTWPGSDVLVVSTGGTEAVRWDASQNQTNVGRTFVPDGATSTPTIALTSNNGSGIFGNSGQIGMIYNGIGNGYFVMTNLRMMHYQNVVPNGASLYELGTTTNYWEHVAASTYILAEQAAAPADTAGFGQLWVDDNVAQTLYFTDDAGVDFPLGGALATGGGLTALSVVNIDDPSTELNAIAGSSKGDTRLVYQTVAGKDEWTIYAWDDADSGIEKVPELVDGSSGMWSAIGGKYNSGAIQASANTDTSFVLGRTRIGSWASDNAYFSHYDHGSATSYALRQSNSGAVTFNTAAASVLNLAVGGTNRWSMFDTYFRSALGQGPSLQNENTTATNPVLIPNQLDLTTGIGANASGEISFITGATEALRIDASQNALFSADAELASGQKLQLDATGNTYVTSAGANGMQIHVNGATAKMSISLGEIIIVDGIRQASDYAAPLGLVNRRWSTVFAGNLSVTPQANASGVEVDLIYTAPAHTNLTTLTEVPSVLFDMSATMQHATGAIVSQSAMKLLAPTYSFVGASIITNADTVYIDNAPTAGTNATITMGAALRIGNGALQLPDDGGGGADATVAALGFTSDATRRAGLTRNFSNGDVYVQSAGTDNLYLGAGGVLLVKVDTSTMGMTKGGTEALPVFWLNNDVDTGLWKPAADTLAVSTAATEAVQWDASQNQINAGDISIPADQALRLNGSGGNIGVHEEGGGIALFIGANYAQLTTSYLYLLHGVSSTVARYSFEAGASGLGRPASGEVSMITGSVERQHWSANTAGLPVSTISRNAVAANIPRTNGYEYVALALRNNTAATAGPTHQNSPALSWEGSQWDTDSTSAADFKWTAYADGDTTAAEGSSGTNWYLDVDGGEAGPRGGSPITVMEFNAYGNMVLPNGNLWVSTGNITVNSGSLTVNGTSTLDRTIVSQPASTQNLPPAALLVNYAAHTTMGNTQNHPHVHFDFGNADANWDGAGTAAIHTAFKIDAPTYVATTATQTITNAATLYVEGAPIASTNVAITNPLALWVDSGESRFDGVVTMNSDLTISGADIDADGGFRRELNTWRVDVPSASTTYTLNSEGTTSTGNDWDGVWLAATSGSPVALACWVSSDLTAGSIGFWVQGSTDGGDTWSDKWGSTGSPVVTLSSGGSAEYATTTAAKDLNTFAKDEMLRVRAVFDGSYSGSRDAYASLTVEA